MLKKKVAAIAIIGSRRGNRPGLQRRSRRHLARRLLVLTRHDYETVVEGKKRLGRSDGAFAPPM